MKIVNALALVAAITLAGCSAEGATPASGLKVSSPAFADGAAIPRKHACAAQGGQDVSPPLKWSGVPSSARELAIVVDDPDAPGGSYIHWLVTGVSTTATGAAEGEAPGRVVRGNGGDPAYAGPCPPSGVHHYHFIVYALPGPVVSSGGPQEVHQRIKNSAIASGETIGTFAH
ncbi:YbhB/YbcL family Raf kinase inhibitor-like protein [Sphaerisporangium album]|uniref:YbhB/YbcL family Raf kinase inhibitor-like protein n=1 Tax=Sphaerisporangium album TaxID=509200 RepID=A0A367FM70_9ACTN|nr:YbhB/YbcL family Raf kinase inhibitor-like protein [Sphaerisporangium album]RCG30999.1 YbhB/YbcL family Raf kinase inhibitor-like protein [Sphaerisporangium album]